jgi:hypothetical protein
MAGFPKILIATPTYEGKNYCLAEFMDNVASFTYPRQFCKFVVFDNSATPANAEYISKKYKVDVVWKDYAGTTVIEKLALTHEAIRNYAINNGYDFILHLESDVFPSRPDVIEQLLFTRKKIVGVPYMLFSGGQRRLITTGIPRLNARSENFIGSYQLGHHHHWFVDGTVKRCGTNGLGCTLLHVKTIAGIPFRFVPGDDAAPDTHFSRDLLLHNIPYYVHTGLHAFHWNKEEWGVNANLIKYDKSE